MLEPMKPASMIEICGNGHTITLELLCRDYPDAEDYWDGNWVATRFRMDAPGISIVFTKSLHLGDLERFRHEIERLSQERQGEAVLAMMEQYFTITAVLRPYAIEWTVRIRVRQPARTEGVPRPPLRILRHVAFEAASSSLPVLLEQVQAALTVFSIRSPRAQKERTDKSRAAVTAFLGSGGDPNRQVAGGRPLLSVVAHTGETEAVRLLLDSGADLHHVDSTGATALWGAAGNGRVDIVRLLLERGARVNDPGEKGDTVLMLASRNGYDARCPAVVRLLLEAGADTRAREQGGWTALIWAAGHGQEAVTRLLIEHGADVNAATNDGQTPLMRAAQGGYLEIVRLLREQGADASLRDRRGRTARDWAEEVGWADAGVNDALR